LRKPKRTSPVAIKKTSQSPQAIMMKGLVGPILSNAWPPNFVNIKVPRFANKFNVPTIAPRMSSGIVLKKSTSTLDDYIAEAIMMQEHST